MARATISWSLPKERIDFNRASKADDMANFIWDFQQYLRGVVKYQTGDDAEHIYEKWFEIMGENDINIDNLIE